MRQILTDVEQAQILNAVKRAETRTRGEIVTVIARQSDDYYALSLAISTCFAFVSSLITHILAPAWSFQQIWFLQLGVFAIALAILKFNKIFTLILPPSYLQNSVRRHARAQFHAQGMHATESRAGVMIFISLNERCIELIADIGIADKEQAGVWHVITEQLTGELRQGRIAQGITQAIESCAVILERHYPVEAGLANPNELSDTIIQLH